MSAWRRATLDDRCGNCGLEIAKGAPMLVLHPRGTKRRLVRCERCAGPAPPELPDHVETTAPEVRLQQLGLLPLDWKRHA